MKVLMTGGGTGGHVYPALAIAETIKTNIPDAQIAFVGTEKGIENRLVPKMGYKLYHIDIQGISRSLSPKNIKTAYLIMTSPYKAKKIIEEFKPDIVIGTGGYVCWPLLKAASSMGIPSMVHESNAYPGLAVRQLQNKVDVVLTSFDETAQRLSAKERVVNVGNPIRLNYSLLDKAEARRRLMIPDNIKFVALSFGGSLGAKGINDTAMTLMEQFTLKNEDVLHVHATGTRFYDSFSEEQKNNGLLSDRIRVVDYLYEMPLYMAAADVVVCRAGAMTLAELAMIGKPAILIPSPNVTDDHQYKNAKVIADKGGAVLIRENEDTAAEAVRAMDKFYCDRDLLRNAGAAMESFARPDAGKFIYKEIEKVIDYKRKTVK